MTRWSRLLMIAAALVAAGAGLASAEGKAAAPNTCVTCHAAEHEARLSAPVAALGNDIHARRGFSCVDCHGGDASATDPAKAMAPSAGFRGRLTGQTQVQACARCHADAALMRKFAPKQRVDQATEYAASVHGKRLAAGDGRVATCASCHGSHGMRVVADTQSPVYPTNVDATCGRCHADAARMTRADGTKIQATVVADYRASVHHDALTKGHDLSAPTCNDCHGNHGAAPPGVDAVANVCGTCHAVFAARFAGSPHQPVFEKACVECHGNHAVKRPNDALVGTAEGAICATCHADKDDAGYQGAAAMRGAFDGLSAHIARAEALVERARNAGMEVGDQHLAIAKARDQLMLARTDLHAFDPKKVLADTAEGDKAAAEAEAGGRQALADVSFRRKGLAASMAVILLVVGALWLKIKELDRRREREESGG